MKKIFGKKTWLVTFDQYDTRRKTTERFTVTVSNLIVWFDSLPRGEYTYTVIFAIEI